MRYASFGPDENRQFSICVLVPKINKQEILDTYITPFGIDPQDVLILDLHQSEGKKKTPMSVMRAYIEEELTSVLENCGVEYLIVADSDYFKAFTKEAKTEVHLGYVIDSPFGPWKVSYVPNFRQIFYDPENVRAKIAQGVRAITEHQAGRYEIPGTDIVKFSDYPTSAAMIEAWLEDLITAGRDLTCDIEAFSLKHHTAGIGTISFAWDKHEGIAFPVDLGPEPKKVRALLKSFFERFTGRLIYHGVAYDVYVLIYQLFMQDILDTEGLLDGLKIMLSKWHCTRIITYLATNSCAGNNLKLKYNSQEFSGNYAVEDIHDIRKIPLDELLRYNLIDSLSTWFVFEKYWGTLVADQQLDIYENLFQPATWDIIQMQLTGMPLNMERVKEVRAILDADEAQAVADIQASPVIQRFVYKLEEEHIRKRNEKLKKKQIVIGDEPQEFNPNSPPQLQLLLYDHLQLPVLAKTDSGLPSTDGDTLKALRLQTSDPDLGTLLDSLSDYKSANKLTTSFLPAMEAAALGPDGWHYLFGNFNLGGTLSGRLSSSKPNLQNLPSNGKSARQRAYAKLIKSCFQAPPGWLFVGLDFDSLEDKISAVTTKDPEKLKVYTDGYDGHSLRAYSYFKEQMPDIDPTSVASINSIQVVHKELRQESKVPTFALTYDGTFVTLMANSGFDMAKAKMIEARYHELYAHSDKWISAKLDEASRNGYVTVAFGLRVRTPLLKQVIRKTRATPFEAEAEGRSAGNALGQSWCLLNSRAGMAFMQKVRASKERLNIKPCSQIHDAGYFLIRDSIKTLHYTNENLVKEVEWQEHPDIQHDEVKLSGKLGIFHPHWGKEITIPNGASEAEIFSTIDAAMV